MTTTINPQEIFLLERFSSTAYFGELRDTWGEMIHVVETSLNHFMKNLPLDYRNRPQPEQPDVVWGERVLPNFRDTYHNLCDGYIRLAQGDILGLDFCNGPLNDFKGQQDFWAGWMQQAEENRYHELLLAATNMAGNICATAEALWEPLELGNEYTPEVRGQLAPPATWPAYKINYKISVDSGSMPSANGIYVPTVDSSCAEFLSKEFGPAPEAKVFLGKTSPADEEDSQNIIESRPCEWLLVERIIVGDEISRPSLLESRGYRVVAGTPCPESGYYFTPAKEVSRRYFSQHEIMPTFDSTYGLVIWQWDTNQS